MLISLIPHLAFDLVTYLYPLSKHFTQPVMEFV